MNLIVNALDAVGEEGGTITVEIDTEPGETVVIRVADNGSGIDEEMRGRIFDPFFTTKEVGAGGSGFPSLTRSSAISAVI
ncbi:ATP-binding protein [Breoghania sp.]|uniref:ATP-binding protein n=1 Tax=Breoghania sp. TaxID=2065378 RepID=UPI002604D4E5|nr:ATP-binding protein [Breoghania sp.]MDJ0930086.1 ATP-binding protein [Breoghania sp.]